MKKKLMTLLCAMTLMCAMTMNVSAESSPEGQPDNTPSDSATETAPKMGETNLFVYGIVAAALLTGTAVVSKKKLEELN